MTLDELRDWHFNREGWRWVDAPDQPGYFVSRDGRKSRHDPFPATLGGADASFPPKWRWARGLYFWSAEGTAGHNQHKHAKVQDTGDKIHDLYELSMKAWEQEAA